MGYKKFIVFEIHGESYAIDIAYMDEIYMKTGVEKIPCQKNCVKGIVNKGGSMETVIDLRMLIQGESTRDGWRNSFLAMKNGQSHFSFEINDFAGIVKFDADKVRPSGEDDVFLSGFLEIGKDIVGIVDYLKVEESIFKEEEIS